MILYRELDNTIKEEDLEVYERNLRDRFGPLPTEALELINVVRLRWKAMHLGFEKLTLKNGKMLCYFVSQKNSEYFSSPIFKGALKYAQDHPRLCHLKEQNNKLMLTVEDVKSISKASTVLVQIEKLVEDTTIEQ